MRYHIIKLPCSKSGKQESIQANKINTWMQLSKAFTSIALQFVKNFNDESFPSQLSGRSEMEINKCKVRCDVLLPAVNHGKESGSTYLICRTVDGAGAPGDWTRGWVCNYAKYLVGLV